MITETEIFARLTALHSALVEKLGAQPFLTPSLMLESDKCKIAIYSAYNGGHYEVLHRAVALTVIEAIFAAEAYVSDMPNADMSARKAWHGKLATVIDEGHALALPDDVMQPLRGASQAMHKNLLVNAK